MTKGETQGEVEGCWRDGPWVVGYGWSVIGRVPGERPAPTRWRAVATSSRSGGSHAMWVSVVQREMAKGSGTFAREARVEKGISMCE